jgi:hypothetical protein
MFDQYILKKHKRLGIRIIRVIKSRRRRLAGHITHMGEERCREDFWWENLRERDDLRPRHRWEENIKNVSSGSGMGAWTGLLCLRKGTGGEFLWM